MTSKILLSFDIEEFDMPLEYGDNISPREQMEIGKRGFDGLMPLLTEHNINCTLFTTANYALHFPDSIKAAAEKHEIASHTFYHSQFETEHLLQSKNALEIITGKPVTGLRMPRMKKVDMADVADAGYSYDSSINPTWLPGRYNNLSVSRTAFIDKNILRIPASVSPMRLPLFWLAFKNYPYFLFKYLCKQTLKKDGYLCLYFHPWEFTNIEGYKMPPYTKRCCGKRMLHKLDKLICDLKSEGEFITMQTFASKIKI
ncbi:polysaccharide deacetylase family protein [soil metagenome]